MYVTQTCPFFFLFLHCRFFQSFCKKYSKVTYVKGVNEISNSNSQCVTQTVENGLRTFRIQTQYFFMETDARFIYFLAFM